ncbi:hypothetical protein Dsin_028841 [Dipteronia sinensis]|uniref:hAT-like transposase RNase-H fold domain-containing protein n=1 Tax=Dipteronia sinensis TaxID=43782 RepID=A0AAE0DUS6_9ROSI|nr:hypothetical protein Dsin_028841 [Dipteronia sinensis]
MCDNLKLFYDVFEMSSGKKHPTTSQFFPTLCKIRLLMSKWLTSRYDEIKLITSNAIAKFEQYWNVINGMISVATVLDPRFKMKVLKFFFPQIYGDNSSFEMEKVCEICYGLVKEYQLNSKTGKEPCDHIDSSCSPSLMSISKDKVDDHLPNSDLFASSTTTAENVKSELDKYLEETLSPRIPDFDLLGWWKINAFKYHTLHDIAKDV